MSLLLLFLVYAVILSVALGRAGHHTRITPSIGEPRTKPARILIVGATGGTGRQLVTQALDRGYVVTALARDPAQLQLNHPRLTVVRGDVLDAGSVERALAGQDAVLSALGHRPYFYPTNILSLGTHNILRAMEIHGVRRLVCETSLGIGDSAGRLGLSYSFFIIPVILPFYFWDKTRQEKEIVGSNAEWVIVRPGALTNGPRRGVCRHGPQVGSWLQTVRISRAEVADFM